MLRIAVVGATGAVGKEALALLEKHAVPIEQLRCFASPRSVGICVSFRGQDVRMETLEEASFAACDVALFCAGGKVSQTWVPIALQQGARVVDCSSFFRMDPAVPLIIPEINAHALHESHRLIASPNCSTTIMLMALAPLHRAARIKRVVAATYQAASGAGAQAMKELLEETLSFLAGETYERSVMPFPYAFNLFAHNSLFNENGYAEEELKMRHETQKILEDPTIQVHATCVRVPVLRAHSEALNVTFEREVSVEEAYTILKNAPGLAILEDRARNRFPMPIDAMQQELVYCGRIRKDPTHPNTLDLWVVGDQLLKGAALNAIQIMHLPCFLKST
jgi:aspartate-semialdehyde dehydrogenase